MAESQSFINKIKDVQIVSNSFTPEGEKEAIAYKQLVLVVEYDGEEDTIVIKKDGTNASDISKFLKGADEQAR